MSGRSSPVLLGVVFGALLTPGFVALGAPTVALPDLASGLHVPFGQTAWVLTAWALMSAVAMPVFGTLAGRLGGIGHFTPVEAPHEFAALLSSALV